MYVIKTGFNTTVHKNIKFKTSIALRLREYLVIFPQPIVHLLATR